MFKMRPDKRDRMEEFIAKLRRLEHDVPGIRAIEVSTNAVSGLKSFDIYYYAKFDNRAGFEAYMAHPRHVPVIAYVDEVCSDVADVDVQD
jgi:hypothetical protein